MEYRCIATSVTGFVQQLVSCYLPHGYWFYVSGIIPPGKDPEAVDEKLLVKYGIGMSRSSRARRKAVGIANVHYLRYQRRFFLLATHGFHPFYDNEIKNIRDARRIPIKFEGDSISVGKGGYCENWKKTRPLCAMAGGGCECRLRRNSTRGFGPISRTSLSTGLLGSSRQRSPTCPLNPTRRFAGSC